LVEAMGEIENQSTGSARTTRSDRDTPGPRQRIQLELDPLDPGVQSLLAQARSISPLSAGVRVRALARARTSLATTSPAVRQAATSRSRRSSGGD
jgi:hypothetical protein